MKAGELRRLLVDAIDDLKTGKLKANDAKAIAALAGQVNLSLQVELNMRVAAAAQKIDAEGSVEVAADKPEQLPPPAPPNLWSVSGGIVGIRQHFISDDEPLLRTREDER
jgi:hypothetical protein